MSANYTPIACPECGGPEVVSVETISCTLTVAGIGPEGEVHYADVPTEIDWGTSECIPYSHNHKATLRCENADCRHEWGV